MTNEAHMAPETAQRLQGARAADLASDVAAEYETRHGVSLNHTGAIQPMSCEAMGMGSCV